MRLKTIRDMDQNVVKVFDYEYQASPHSFYNSSQSRVFTRNNCTACQVGGLYIDSVPANKYSSVQSPDDANQQALDEIVANGQNNANLYGTCSAPPIAPINASDGATVSFTVSFHNICTNTNYVFTLNHTTGINWNTVPVGNYNVTMAPVGGSGTYSYTIDGFNAYTTTANFSNIVLSASSNTVIIH